MAYPPAAPDMPLPTVRTALAAHCVLDALCLECDRVRRLDLAALTRQQSSDHPNSTRSTSHVMWVISVPPSIARTGGVNLTQIMPSP
jgi:hypothetical protein